LLPAANLLILAPLISKSWKALVSNGANAHDALATTALNGGTKLELPTFKGAHRNQGNSNTTFTNTKVQPCDATPSYGFESWRLTPFLQQQWR
jgi:hypothetical protein